MYYNPFYNLLVLYILISNSRHRKIIELIVSANIDRVQQNDNKKIIKLKLLYIIYLDILMKNQPKGANQGSNKNLVGSGKIPKVTAKDRIPPAEVAELRQVFDLFDEDHGGTIDPKEIQGVLEQLGLDKRNPIVFSMIQDIKEKNTTINFDDFLEIVVGRLGDVKTRDGLQKLFKLYDTEDLGYVDFESLKAMGRQLGETLNDDEILEMMHHIHILNKTEAGDSINFEEFYKIITKRKY